MPEAPNMKKKRKKKPGYKIYNSVNAHANFISFTRRLSRSFRKTWYEITIKDGQIPSSFIGKTSKNCYEWAYGALYS